jgi:hypothetical protein
MQGLNVNKKTYMLTVLQTAGQNVPECLAC